MKKLLKLKHEKNVVTICDSTMNKIAFKVTEK